MSDSTEYIIISDSEDDITTSNNIQDTLKTLRLVPIFPLYILSPHLIKHSYLL